MSSNSTYLITGVTRGIGHGLLKSYLSRPNHTIIAAVRDPSSASSTALSSIPTAPGSNLITVKIDSSSATDPSTAIAELKSKHSISAIDVVIANAGLGDQWTSVLDTTPESIRAYHEINTIAPLLLFQATYPLLKNSKQPKFIYMGTGVSSFTLADTLRVPCAGYGASKAAASFLVRKAHFEHEELTAVILYPGWVKTEMGNTLAGAVGMGEAQTTLEDSVKGIMKEVDEATREKTGGKFIDFEGNAIPW